MIISRNTMVIQKTWQYFGNVRHNMAPVNAFIPQVVKMVNHAGLWDNEFTWYSPITTHQIWLNGLKHILGIHSFRLIWSSLIIKALATREKFIQPSGYCTEINRTFIFLTTKVFGCFRNVIDQLKPVKHEWPKKNALNVLLCGFQKSHLKCEAMHNVSAHHLPRYYQSRQVPSKVWTAFVTWYRDPILIRDRIL